MTESISETYINAIQEYLESVKSLPAKGGKAFIKLIIEEITAKTGIKVPSQTLYKNPICRNLINKRCKEQGIEGIVKRKIIKNGEENTATQALRKYLKDLCQLPARSGKVNATEIARKAGIKRSDLYRGTCRELLNQTCEAKGIIGIEFEEDIKNQVEDHIIKQLENENSELKKKNSALYAEVNIMHKKVEKYKKIPHLVEQGRLGILDKEFDEDIKNQVEDHIKKQFGNVRKQLENENSELKKKNSDLYTDVNDLRKNLDKYKKIVHLMGKGHQVIP